jgi:hypothetical protein
MIKIGSLVEHSQDITTKYLKRETGRCIAFSVVGLLEMASQGGRSQSATVSVSRFRRTEEQLEGTARRTARTGIAFPIAGLLAMAGGRRISVRDR